MTIVIDDEVCKKFVTEECLVGETLSDFAKRMKKKYDYLYTTDLKIGEVKVVLNPSINKKYGEKEGLDHIMTARNNKLKISQYDKNRIERVGWVDIMFKKCSTCPNMKVVPDKNHQTHDKKNYRINVCCKKILYMVTLEYIARKSEYLIITAFPISMGKYINEFK